MKDPKVRQFIEKCLANVSLRLSARELLNDPFLQTDDCEINFQPIECRRDLGHVDPVLRHPFPELDYKGNSFNNSSYNEYSNGVCSDDQNGWGYQPTDIEQNGIDLFEYNDDEHEEHFAHLDITIKGKRREDGSIFLRLRISDKDGRNFKDFLFVISTNCLPLLICPFCSSCCRPHQEHILLIRH